MPRLVPKRIRPAIEFFEQRLDPWSDHAADIGLTEAHTDRLGHLIAGARASYDDATAARAASGATTTALHNSLRPLQAFGADLIRTIRAKAETDENPAIYELAMIPPPAPRHALPAPAPATRLGTRLMHSGAVELTWRGTIARGTFYSVYRRLGCVGGFSLIGSVAAKRCIDEAVPAGTAEIAYYVVALRGGLRSDASEVVTMRFGAQEAREKSERTHAA